MSNIVKLNSHRLYYKVVVTKYIRENQGEDRLYKRALIVIADLKSEKTVVHDFSEFIIKKYRNKQIKTQVDYANKIVRFMNFVKVNLDKKNLNQIDFEDIRDFLQYVALNSNKETVHSYKRILIIFYEYLAKKEFLLNVSRNDFYYREKIVNGYKKITLDADIDEVDVYNNPNKLKNNHSMSYPLQAMLLNVAFEEVNIIALGLAFQMFGGLRTGEVVNLSYASIQTIGKYGRFGVVLDVRDRDFRDNISMNDGKGYGKRSRYQQVLSPFGIIETLLKAHRSKYRTNNNNGAIFTNKNGEAMSYASYMYYFGKLKKIFIKRLKESTDPKLKTMSIILAAKKWNSHIGRGIFTNNLEKITDNASQLQVARGDMSIESSNTYIDDSEELGRRFEENSENVFRDLMRKIDK